MPTYEYECKKCGRFEKFQRITDEKLKRCPTCKGVVKRMLGSGAGIIFKGTGFYQTDYRSDSYRKGAKSDSGAASSVAPTKKD
jgi:putative FmdB family regulatory protein